MILNTTLEEVQKLYPEIVESMKLAAEKKLKRSRNKKKGKNITELIWSYSHYLRCKAYRFNELLDGTTQADSHAFSSLSVDEKVADIVNRTGVCINATMPGASVTSDLLPTVPQVLVDKIREGVIKQQAEQDRINSLTDEERNAKIVELLEQLKGPGFFVV